MNFKTRGEMTNWGQTVTLQTSRCYHAGSNFVSMSDQKCKMVSALIRWAIFMNSLVMTQNQSILYLNSMISGTRGRKSWDSTVQGIEHPNEADQSNDIAKYSCNTLDDSNEYGYDTGFRIKTFGILCHLWATWYLM